MVMAPRGMTAAGSGAGPEAHLRVKSENGPSDACESHPAGNAATMSIPGARSRPS